MGINTTINIFKENMANVINNSQLPVGVVYFVVKDILLEVEGAYKATLQKESQEMLAKLEQEERERADVAEHQE